MAVAGDRNYAETVVNGDIHTANQEAAGLATRSEAKTFIYGLLYGAGDAKLGAISGKSAAHGARMRRRFFDALPALGKLVRTCQKKAEDRGFLLGLDKRKLHCRSAHSSLNLLLQSAGGVICKKWIVEMDALFQERGLDVQYHAWVHDEVQLSCPPEQAELVGQACQDAMRLTQEKLSIQCQLDTDFNVGANWAETH